MVLCGLILPTDFENDIFVGVLWVLNALIIPTDFENDVFVGVLWVFNALIIPTDFEKLVFVGVICPLWSVCRLSKHLQLLETPFL